MTSPRSSLIGLIVADALSRVGSVMTITAIPWFVLVTTGSPARTGLTVFVEAVAVSIALLFGGAFVDRLPLRVVSPVADVTAGAAICLIPVLHLTVGLSFGVLLLLVFFGSIFSIPAAVARYSALPDLAATADVRFERANAIFDGSLTAASLVGPAIAGVLIAWIGATNVLWFDVMTFGLSALIVLALVPGYHRAPADLETGGALLGQIADGFRFLMNDSVLRPLILFLAITNLAIGPIESVFVPVLARDHYHSAYALGWMTSAIAIGALGGNAVFGAVGHRLSRRAVFASGFATVPVAFVLLALNAPLGASIALLATVGLGLSLMNLVEYTILFERIPAGMRARGLGISGALSSGAVPVGRVSAGILLGVVGLSATLGAFALVFAPVSLAIMVVAPLRVIDQRITASVQSETT